MQEFKTIFLFGAGASYGSGDATIQPERPPLGQGLAKSLAEKYLLWSYYYPNFTPQEWEDFESRFGKLLEENINLLCLFRELAHYFASFRIVSRDNRYCKLIQRLSETGNLELAAFATLNYDTLFEQALLLQSRRAICIDPRAALQKNESLLLKIHGSASFRLNKENVQLGNAQISPSWCLDAPIEEMTRDEAIDFYNDQKTVKGDDPVQGFVMPPMCLYTKNKNVNIGSSAIDAIKNRYAEIIYGADRMFIIGASAALHDTHVWEPIKTSNAKLFYCGSESDMSKIAAYMPLKQCEHVGTTFEQFLERSPFELA